MSKPKKGETWLVADDHRTRWAIVLVESMKSSRGPTWCSGMVMEHIDDPDKVGRSYDVRLAEFRTKVATP